jgi:restriction endonuclease S subunit
MLMDMRSMLTILEMAKKAHDATQKEAITSLPVPADGQKGKSITLNGSTLGSMISVKLNDPDADFWIVRRGTIERVGSPTKEFNPENYGITVTSKEMLPQYLFYALQNVHGQGYFKLLARGSIKLVGIRADDIKNIKVRAS